MNLTQQSTLQLNRAEFCCLLLTVLITTDINTDIRGFVQLLCKPALLLRRMSSLGGRAWSRAPPPRHRTGLVSADLDSDLRVILCLWLCCILPGATPAAATPPTLLSSWPHQPAARSTHYWPLSPRGRPAAIPAPVATLSLHTTTGLAPYYT